MKKKRKLTILDLPFISILDSRPKPNQFIMLAWDIEGYCGYESTYWNVEEGHCKHAVAWLPLPETHVYSKGCAIVLRRKWNTKAVLLKWSKHFSLIKDGKYIKVREKPYAEASN